MPRYASDVRSSSSALRGAGHTPAIGLIVLIRMSSKSGMMSNWAFLPSWSPTRTWKTTRPQASASAMPGIRRMACTNWSSNGWLVVIIALKGLADALAVARSLARSSRDPAIMPTANTPTAIESTTRMVRVMLLVRSARTLRQRGLSMRDLALAHRDILGGALVGHTADRLASQLRIAN